MPDCAALDFLHVRAPSGQVARARNQKCAGGKLRIASEHVGRDGGAAGMSDEKNARSANACCRRARDFVDCIDDLGSVVVARGFATHAVRSVAAVVGVAGPQERDHHHILDRVRDAMRSSSATRTFRVFRLPTNAC